MAQSESGKLKNLFVCHSSFPLAGLSRRGGESYKPLCAEDPLSSLICFGFMLQGWHYAAHRPSWATKGIHRM